MRSVLITGGSAGIGRDLAFCFARAEWQVTITFNRDHYAAVETLAECRTLGAPHAALLGLDVTNRQSVDNLVASLRGHLPHVFVHNAGVLEKKQLFEQALEDIERQVAVNLTGPMLMTQLLADVPTHVFIGSDIGVSPIPGMAPYCATKAGLRAFAQSFALERPDRGVLCLHPDRTSTRMNAGEGRPIRETAEAIFERIARFESPGYEDALLF